VASSSAETTRARFEADGYVVGPTVFSADQVAALREAMERVYDGGGDKAAAGRWGGWVRGQDPDSLRKTDNVWLCDSAFEAAVTNPLIGRLAAELMGVDGIRLWQDQLLYKPGEGVPTGVVGWHQDWYYWQGAAATPDLLTAWIALDDIAEETGPMRVVPGSHHWGLVDVNDFFANDLADQEIRLRRRGDFQPVSLLLGAGQVSFHHCLTLHGSAPNVSAGPRRALAVHLMVDGLSSRPGGDGHYNLDLLTELGGRPGDAFEGDSWPVIYRHDRPAV
jgi:ectoine hydroxylase-related dioxygenase (phytanoyl-CoA dioxygenase family)